MSTEVDKSVKRDRVIHYLLMSVISGLILFSCAFVYLGVSGKISPHSDISDIQSEEEKAPAHPLPDFIVDKINPDELEQLKP